MCCTRGLIDKSMETYQSIFTVPQPVAGLAMLHTVPQSVPQANTLFTGPMPVMQMHAGGW